MAIAPLTVDDMRLCLLHVCPTALEDLSGYGPRACFCTAVVVLGSYPPLLVFTAVCFLLIPICYMSQRNGTVSCARVSPLRASLSPGNIPLTDLGCTVLLPQHCCQHQ